MSRMMDTSGCSTAVPARRIAPVVDTAPRYIAEKPEKREHLSKSVFNCESQLKA